MYTKLVYDVNFSEDFSRIIRRPNSWQDTDAWDVLRAFRGNLLIFKAEKDEIIPEDLVNKLYDSAPLALSREIVGIPGDHFIGRYLAAHPEVQQVVNEKILKLVIPTAGIRFC